MTNTTNDFTALHQATTQSYSIKHSWKEAMGILIIGLFNIFKMFGFLLIIYLITLTTTHMAIYWVYVPKSPCVRRLGPALTLLEDDGKIKELGLAGRS